MMMRRIAVKVEVRSLPGKHADFKRAQKTFIQKRERTKSRKFY